MERLRSSDIYLQPTGRNTPEDLYIHQYGCEILNYCIIYI